MNAFKAELTKLTSLRSTWVYVILMFGAIVGPITLMAFIPSDGPKEFDWENIAIGEIIFLLIAMIFASSSISNDLSNRMVAHSFLTQRKRSHWLIAKFVLIVLVIEVMLAIGIALSYLVLQVAPDVDFTGGDTYGLWLMAWTLPAYSLMAAGITAIFRSKLMGVGVMIALMLIIEPLVMAAVGKAAWLKNVYLILPGSRSGDLSSWHFMESMGADPSTELMASPGVATTVIIVWTLALIAGGLFANQTRDVK